MTTTIVWRLDPRVPDADRLHEFIADHLEIPEDSVSVERHENHAKLRIVDHVEVAPTSIVDEQVERACKHAKMQLKGL